MIHSGTFSLVGRRSVALVCAAGIAAASSAPALAQTTTPDTAEHKHSPLFTKRDAWFAAGFAATTIAMFPLDRRIARRLQDPATQENRFFKNSATGVELIASPGAYFIGAGLWVTGKLTGSHRLADLGWHGTEAVLFGEAITHTLKGTLGRARPYVSGAQDPDDFKFGAGFTIGSDRRSFPSGHTTTAFAAAAAVTSEVTRWYPKSKWYVGTAMYGGATLVGLSRMYNNKHWGSDVALGALIGTFAGWKAVQFAHDHPNNDLDRWMLHTKFFSDAGVRTTGVGLMRKF